MDYIKNKGHGEPTQGIQLTGTSERVKKISKEKIIKGDNFRLRISLQS